MSPPRHGEPSPHSQPARHDSDEDDLNSLYEPTSAPDDYDYPSPATRQYARQYARSYASKLVSPLVIGNRRTLVGLVWQAPYWLADVDVPFRPEGLIVLQAPVGTMLCEWLVGADRILPAGRAPILLSTFTRIEQGRYEAARPSYSSCGPGVTMRLRLSSKSGEPLPPEDVELTVWGRVPVYV